jgi:GntR family transcriptional regulator
LRAEIHPVKGSRLQAGVNRMDFFIDKHSSIPVAAQIQEQIKLAVMMGVFRNGDTLPSIRDIEKQTGINRSQIHKAYLALRKSGLLVLIRGKGTTVVTATDSPRAVDDNCRKLSKKIFTRVRQMGISPVAFARYLARYTQENESKAPFIIYADMNKEIAEQTAEEISKWWQVPVVGMEYRELNAMVGRGSARRKILVSHLACDQVREMLPKIKSDVIPIEIDDSDQTRKAFRKLKKNATMLAVHVPQPAHRLEFILASLKKLAEPRGIQISSAAVRDTAGLRELLKNEQFDYYLIGHAVRGYVPADMKKNPRILSFTPLLDPASLEVARIKAGVII